VSGATLRPWHPCPQVLLSRVPGHFLRQGSGDHARKCRNAETDRRLPICMLVLHWRRTSAYRLGTHLPGDYPVAGVRRAAKFPDVGVRNSAGGQVRTDIAMRWAHREKPPAAGSAWPTAEARSRARRLSQAYLKSAGSSCPAPSTWQLSFLALEGEVTCWLLLSARRS
jgi:hypothetical protein